MLPETTEGSYRDAVSAVTPGRQVAKETQPRLAAYELAQTDDTGRYRCCRRRVRDWCGGGSDFTMQAFGGLLLVPALITLAMTGPVVLWRTYGPRRREEPPLPPILPPGPPSSITPGFERAHGLAPRDQQDS